MAPSVSFDVLGTCFHFGPVITYIDEKILPKLSASNTYAKTHNTLAASAIFHSWFYAAQRDFTYLSISGNYTPILQVFKSTFRRAAYIVGLPSAMEIISDKDIDGLMACMRSLPARSGLKDCFEMLRGEGFDVLAVTNGGREGTEGYFGKAGVGIRGEDVLSCDEIEVDDSDTAGAAGGGRKGVAKPDFRVYQRVNQVLDRRQGGKEGSQGSTNDRWFVAAHSWDLIAARNAGFRTAWVSHEEGDSCSETLFGKFDVYADGLEECARQIVEMTKR